MTALLIEIGEIRDASEDAQQFARLAIEERDPEKREIWKRNTRLAMGVVRAKTALVDAEIGGWR